jgi:hypothetical protein
MELRFLPSKPIINSRSTTFKVVITFCLGLGFLIVSPIIVAVSPFFFAWKIVSNIIVVPSVKKETVSLPESRWGKFQVDYESWKREA